MPPRGVAAALCALLVAGCTLFGQGTFALSFPVEPGAAAAGGVAVILTDRTGTVASVDLPDLGPNAPAFREGAAQLPGSPDAIVVGWLGGACDLQVDMAVEGRQGATFVTISTQRAAPPAGCEAVGVPRSVVIRFVGPIDANLVRVEAT